MSTLDPEALDVGVVHGVRARVVACGRGAPTLLLHGNPDTHALWDGVVARLAPRLRCYAPDLPGFGRSRVEGTFDCALDTMARFVDQLVDALGIDRPLNLVVHDFGGPFGLAWAVRHPRRVARIAAINTFFFPDYRWHFWARVWRTLLLGELAMALTGWPLFYLEMRRGSRRLDRGHLRRTWLQVTPAMKRMVLRLYRATDPHVFWGWEDRLLALTKTVPTAVLWGMHDPYLPAAFADRFGAHEVHRIDDCGHWPPAEAPAEVASILERFFLQAHP